MGQRRIVVRTLKLASLLACCAVAANLYAQEGRRGRRGNTLPPAGQQIITTESTTEQGRRGPMVTAVIDRDLVFMLTIGNKAEVEMATFVKDKLQNEQARQFANQMIQEHSQFLQQLAQFTGRGAPGAGAAVGGNAPVGGVAGSPPPVDNPPPGIAPQPNQPVGRGVDVAVGGGQGVNVGVGGAQPGRSFYAPGLHPILSIKQEIAQECMANAKKELESKQGVDFDKCYIGMMLGKHAEMVSVLTVLQRHAQDSQFKELLGAGLQKTQQHLEHAKGIMKQLEKGS